VTRKKEYPPVLVVCVSYAGKEYCLDEYLKSVEAMIAKYPGTARLFFVDNTRYSTGYFDLISSKGYECAHVNPLRLFQDTFSYCWEVAYDYAKRCKYPLILSVEQDNTAPPRALKRMVDVAMFTKAHMVLATYPLHEAAAKASGVPMDRHYYAGLGFTLMSLPLVRLALDHWREFGMFEASMHEVSQCFKGGRVYLNDDFKVRHLDGFEYEFWQFAHEEKPAGTCPTPVGPAGSFSLVPPSIAKDMEGIGLAARPMDEVHYRDKADGSVEPLNVSPCGPHEPVQPPDPALLKEAK